MKEEIRMGPMPGSESEICELKDTLLRLRFKTIQLSKNLEKLEISDNTGIQFVKILKEFLIEITDVLLIKIEHLNNCQDDD